MNDRFAVRSESLLLGCLLLWGGCATTNGASVAKMRAIKKIAENLVNAVEVRLGPQQMRIYMGEIRAVDSGKLESLKDKRLGRELRHHLVMALSGKLNFLERTMTPPPSLSEETTGLRDWAKENGVTHLLVGDYVTRAGNVCVSIRLVDTETKLIVAAAGGTIPNSEVRAGPAYLQRYGLPLTSRYSRR